MDQTEVRTTQSPPRLFQPTIRSHLAFTALSALVLLVMFSLLRLALLIYNRELIGATPASTFLEAFGNGVRFDLRVVVYAVAPLVLSLFAVRAMAARGLFRTWLTLFASITLFLGVLELDFYREFHQRLNSLVFQYMSEDPKTVMSMLWYGFPVVRYLLAWAFATWVLYRVFKAIDLATRPSQRKPREDSVIARPSAAAPWYVRGVVLFLCVLVCVLAARGTLRQGPPLRWGDAFTTESMFANQLGLNGTLTLVKAAKERFSEDRANIWKATLDDKVALETTRQMLLTPNDKLVDADEAAVRREFTPPAANTLPIRNVVVVLLESFAGHYVGALGAPGNITPYFDKLSKEGLLFTQFFSNGTHTHQGMFATMACFPNLPGFEYLMQTPEGGHKFSGLPQLLSARQYEDVYVYNGDFAWDNQSGFFSNQGMTTFIGRNDYVDPVFSDPTWGVSDQDMFARGNEELDKLASTGKPFYALLQSPLQPRALRVAEGPAGGARDRLRFARRAPDRHALFRLGAGPVLREGEEVAVLQGHPFRGGRRPWLRQPRAAHRDGPAPLQRAAAADRPRHPGEVRYPPADRRYPGRHRADHHGPARRRDRPPVLGPRPAEPAGRRQGLRRDQAVGQRAERRHRLRQPHPGAAEGR